MQPISEHQASSTSFVAWLYPQAPKGTMRCNPKTTVAFTQGESASPHVRGMLPDSVQPLRYIGLLRLAQMWHVITMCSSVLPAAQAIYFSQSKCACAIGTAVLEVSACTLDGKQCVPHACCYEKGQCYAHAPPTVRSHEDSPAPATTGHAHLTSMVMTQACP